MSRKAKFTPEEKEQAVIDYLEGNKSRIQICGELCISSRTIQDWALIYNKHGLAGFSKKMRNGSYSKEFKMKVVEESCRNGSAKRERDFTVWNCFFREECVRESGS